MTTTIYTVALIIWFAVLLASLISQIVIKDRLKRELDALEDLIASSPAVCFVCQEYGVEIGAFEDPLKMHERGLQDHEYIEARLVYIPDELLR